MHDDPYELIKEARRLLKDDPDEASRSEGTERDYARMADLLIGSHGGPAEIIERASKTRSASTWFKRRAALKSEARKRIRAALAEQDKVQRIMAQSADENPALYTEWDNQLCKLEFYTELLKALPVGCPIPQSEKRRKHSKNHDLTRLPDDWREQLVDQMSAGKYALATLVAATTGCRPAELVGAVRLRIVSNELIAEIVGAKVKATQGQPLRTLSWQLPREGLVDELVKQVADNGGALSVAIDDTKNFSTAVRAAAKQLWPKHRTHITPYCLRHAFSADLKAANSPREDVAAGMGHLSDQTCQHYGSANQSKGRSVAPDKIIGVRDVLRKYHYDPPQHNTGSDNRVHS